MCSQTWKTIKHWMKCKAFFNTLLCFISHSKHLIRNIRSFFMIEQIIITFIWEKDTKENISNISFIFQEVSAFRLRLNETSLIEIWLGDVFSQTPFLFINWWPQNKKIYWNILYSNFSSLPFATLKSKN